MVGGCEMEGCSEKWMRVYAFLGSGVADTRA